MHHRFSLSHKAPGRPGALLAWLLLLLALPALAARRPDLPDYPADQVAPGLYCDSRAPWAIRARRTEEFMNNPAFLVTETGVIVVDPGSSVPTGQMVLRQMSKVTDKPLLGGPQHPCRRGPLAGRSGHGRGRLERSRSICGAWRVLRWSSV